MTTKCPQCAADLSAESLVAGVCAECGAAVSLASSGAPGSATLDAELPAVGGVFESRAADGDAPFMSRPGDSQDGSGAATGGHPLAAFHTPADSSAVESPPTPDRPVEPSPAGPGPVHAAAAVEYPAGQLPTKDESDVEMELLDLGKVKLPSRRLVNRLTGAAESAADADYEIVGEIGKGGMGIIYRARQRPFTRSVALKQVLPREDKEKSDSASGSGSGSSSSQKRTANQLKLAAEALVTGALDHPNIVAVHDVGFDEDGKVFFAMKSVRGRAWSDLLRSASAESHLPKDERIPTFEENLGILRKVCDAVKFAHSQGIVHNDLKPGNVRVNLEYGEVIVLDWGISWAMPDGAFVRELGALPSRVPSGGSPHYMAPEQAELLLSTQREAASALIGPHTDIYLLGAMLHEIITKQPPHPYSQPDKTDPSRRTSLSSQQIMLLARQNEIIPFDPPAEWKGLYEIARKAMQANPRDRFASVDAFVHAIDQFERSAAGRKLRLQAEEHLTRAEASAKGDYQEYARSVFAAEQAIALDDVEAKQLLSDARDSYATAALLNENYDLGLQVLESAATRPLAQGEAEDANLPQRYRGTYRKLVAGKAARKNARRLNKILKTVAAVLVVGLLGMGGLAGYSYVELLAANGNLKKVREAEALALAAKQNAENEAAAAVQAKAAAEVAKADAEMKLGEANTKLADAEVKAQTANRLAMMAEMNAKMAMTNLDEANGKLTEATDKLSAANDKLKVADNNLKLAEDKVRTADQNLKATEEKFKVVETKLKTADEDIAKANVAKEKAMAAAAEARKNEAKVNYEDLIRRANQEIAQNQFNAARELFTQVEAAVSDKEFPQPRDEAYIRLVQALNLDLARTEGQATTPLTAVSTAAAGTEFVTAADDGTLKIWSTKALDPSMKGLKPAKVVPTGRKLVCLAYSPNGRRLAGGGADGSLWIWSSELAGEPQVLPRDDDAKIGHADRVTRVAFLSDELLASSSTDKTLRIWNLSTGKSIALDDTAGAGHKGEVLAMAVAKQPGAESGWWIVSGGGDRTVRLWNVTKDGRPAVPGIAESQLLVRDMGAAVTALAMAPPANPNGLPTAYLGTDNGVVGGLSFTGGNAEVGAGWRAQQFVRPLESGEELTDSRITGIVLLESDGSLIASLSQDNTGQVWNVRLSSDGLQPPLAQPSRSLKGDGRIKGHGNWIVDGAALYRPDSEGGSLLVTASADGSARVWDPRENSEVEARGGRTLREGKRAELASPVVSVNFAGGKADSLIEIGRDGVAFVRPLNGDKQSVRLAEGYRLFRAVAIAGLPKDRLATMSFDGQLIVWNALTGAAVSQKKLKTSTGLLTTSENSGRILVGIDADAADGQGLVQIGSIEDLLADKASVMPVGGQHRAIRQSDRVDAGAFSPSGELAVVGTSNGFLQVWRSGENWSEPLRAHPPFEIREDSESERKRTPTGVTGVVFVSESRVLSAGLDGMIRQWEVTAGGLTEVGSPVSLGSRMLALGLTASADGRRAAVLARMFVPKNQPETAEVYAQVRLLNVNDNQLQWGGELLPFDPGSAVPAVSAIEMSASGTRLLVTVDGSVQEWIIAAEGTVAENPVSAFARRRGFPVAEARYVSRAADEIALLGGPLVTLWKRAAGEGEFSDLVQSLGLPVASQACDLSTDGKVAVTGSGGFDPAESGLAQIQGEVRVWDVASQKRIAALRTKSLVSVVAIDPLSSANILVARDPEGDGVESIIELFEFQAGNAELRLRLEVGRLTGRICRARFSPDGQRLVVASDAGQIRGYRLRNPQEPEIRPVSLEFREDSFADLGQLGGLVSIDLVGRGDLLAVGGRRQVFLYELKDVPGAGISRTAELQGHSGDLTDVRFCPEEVGDIEGNVRVRSRVWTSGLDGAAKLWSVSRQTSLIGRGDNPADTVVSNFDARPLLSLRGHRGGILSLSVAANGDLATGGQDGRVVYWPTLPTGPVVSTGRNGMENLPAVNVVQRNN